MNAGSESASAVRHSLGVERRPSQRAALVSLALSMLLSSLGISIANVALPTLARAFDSSFQTVQWVVLAYLLAITTLVVSVGRLGDVIGRRRLMLGGLALFTGASLLCGLAPTLSLLIAARAVQGIGAAILMSLTLALVAETVPTHKTGSAMGLLGTMSAIGTALGPSLGGVLIASVGWRWIFLINLPLGLLALVLSHRTLPVDPPARSSNRTRLDVRGMLLLALTLATYALAMTTGRGQPGALNALLLMIAAVSVGLFLRVEAKAIYPLIHLSLFRHAGLSAGFSMSALVTTVLMATLVVGPFYLSGALALDAARVGLVMSAGPIVSALSGVPAGRLVDRFGAHGLAIVGLTGVTLGCVLLATLPATLGVAGYLAPLILTTAGYALFQAANNTAVMRHVAADQRGVVSGILNLSRNLGLITGASAMGAVFALAVGSRELTLASPDAIETGLHATFALAVTLIAVALAIAVRSRASSADGKCASARCTRTNE